VLDRATIPLPDGKTFTVIAKHQGTKNVCVRSISLNGVKLDRHYITQAEIMAGGTLTFDMSATPIEQ
jgi:putative alpha-1,2-mannosidase